MKNASPLPDVWIQSYARERRRAFWLRVWNTLLNLATVVGLLTLAYFALVFCSILEPGAAPQLP